jgi:hypothetical protein
MANVTRKSDLVEIGGGAYRVEAGPPLKRAKATEAILSDDKTAPHYRLAEEGEPPALDALGQPIEEGKQFAYLDWLGERVFYLYRRRDLSEAERAEKETTYTYVYEEVGTFPTEDEAIAAAQAD